MKHFVDVTLFYTKVKGNFLCFMATYIPSIVVFTQLTQRQTALVAAERSYARCKYHRS